MSSIEEYAQTYNDLSDNNEYTQIPLIPNEWKVLKDSTEINTYLPKENNINITTGISTQRKSTLKNFESIDLSQVIQHKRGHVINTGGSIWAIDFVPKRASMHDNHTQYLAVGGYNSTNEHHKFVKEENIYSRNAIQIWRVTSNTEEDTPPVLDMCLLHDFGIVINFKWCPFSVHDEGEKLGILAVLFGDGEVRLLVVPHPHLVRDQENISLQETIYLKVEAPRLVLKLPRMYNLCFSWGGGYRKLACGTKSGNIVVWDILQSLLQTTPIVNINIPNASLLAIKCISWISLFDESLLISSDSDGNINLHDLKDPFLSSKIFRVRCTYICILGTGHGKEFLFGDIDGITRKNTAFSNKKSVTLTMHNSLVWSIAASPFHGIVASAASDGSVMVKPFSSDKYALNPKHKLNVLEYTLYKLTYDNKTNEFRYIDGLKPKTSLPERVYHNMFIDPIVSIHKVAWNNNKNACGWVASGGEAGLLRSEYTGCGQ